jgi:predicted RNA-binding protein with PUA-like domain
MNHWLMKSEPDVWSWQQQLEKGVEGWSGVRSYQAANNLKAMREGDLAFFYHSNIGKEIVGIVEIVREAYPDATDASGRFVMVDVKAVEGFERPVGLAEIKQDPALKEMALLKYARLSVQPVTAAEWQYICRLGGGAKERQDHSLKGLDA